MLEAAFGVFVVEGILGVRRGILVSGEAFCVSGDAFYTFVEGKHSRRLRTGAILCAFVEEHSFSSVVDGHSPLGVVGVHSPPFGVCGEALTSFLFLWRSIIRSVFVETSKFFSMFVKSA